jgi:HEAT repeat protein
MGFLRGKERAHGWGSSGRALALGLVLTGLANAQHGPHDIEDPPTGPIELAFAGPRTPAELRRRLAGMEAAEIPGLFRLAAEGCLSSNDSVTLALLDDDERQVVREALCARPRRELVPFLEDLASQPIGPTLRREAQRLLGCTGSADHLKLLARLTQSFQERGTVPPDLRTGFSDAMGDILARDVAALAQVRALFSESPPGLASPIVEALASQHSSAATRVLADLLGRSPGLDPLLLARLAERGRLRGSGDEAVFESVRRYLRQRDPALVSASVLACGQLGDDGAVEALVDLLDHPDERVRRGVLSALENITTLSFGGEASRWSSWFRAETRWWEEEAEALLVRIERGRGLEFVRAAREALGHRLFRDRIAEAFAQGLQRRSGEELLLSCRALEQLRSPLAVPSLVECLERNDPLVREAAWKALRTITGADLPAEADSWAALAG